MARQKFVLGETAEVKCLHRLGAQLIDDWLAGRVVQIDERMAAVQFEAEVYSSNGWLIPDRILWCAHGSPKIRRPQV